MSSNIDTAETHETKAVSTRVRSDVFRKFSAGHPDRKDLEGIGGDTYKGNDVWVRHAFP